MNLSAWTWAPKMPHSSHNMSPRRSRSVLWVSDPRFSLRVSVRLNWVGCWEELYDTEGYSLYSLITLVWSIWVIWYSYFTIGEESMAKLNIIVIHNFFDLWSQGNDLCSWWCSQDKFTWANFYKCSIKCNPKLIIETEG